MAARSHLPVTRPGLFAYVKKTTWENLAARLGRALVVAAGGGTGAGIQTEQGAGIASGPF